MLYRKVNKLWALMRNWLYFGRLVKFGVAAGVEHEGVLRQTDCNTVVDIGANRGQFALAVRSCLRRARVISFEPLARPAAQYRKVFAGDCDSILHQAAVGPIVCDMNMHVSGRDDSSSLLPITAAQSALFPGTAEADRSMAEVGPLDAYVSGPEIQPPALLKLDVQGFELQALEGCSKLLDRFSWVYVECSFIELYLGQALAHEVIAWLADKGFFLIGIHNVSYDRQGRSIQADFLFKAGSPKCVS